MFGAGSWSPAKCLAHHTPPRSISSARHDAVVVGQVGSLVSTGGEVPHVALDIDGIGVLEGFLADY